MSKQQVADIVAAMMDERGDTNAWYRIPCPWCGHENPSKRNMSVSQESGYFYCHRCQEKGFYKRSHAKEWYIPPVERVLPVQAVQKPKLPDDFVALSETPKSGMDFSFWNYVVGRNVLPETIVDCGVGYCTHGMYRDCIVVPLWDGPELSGFVARNIKDRSYRYPKGFRREISMFNKDRLWDDEPIVVVEGVFDALPHYPHTVAVLGKPSREHKNLLASVRKRVYVMLDGDARAESWALATLLKVKGIDAIYVPVPSGKDPGDATPEEFIKSIQQASEEVCRSM
jgi:hypothetical protein